MGDKWDPLTGGWRTPSDNTPSLDTERSNVSSFDSDSVPLTLEAVNNLTDVPRPLLDDDPEAGPSGASGGPVRIAGAGGGAATADADAGASAAAAGSCQCEGAVAVVPDSPGTGRKSLCGFCMKSIGDLCKCLGYKKVEPAAVQYVKNPDGAGGKDGEDGEGGSPAVVLPNLDKNK